MTSRPFATDPAPDWRSRPLDWCLWYLRENAHLYAAFRDEVDARLAQYPTARISADAVMHHIRWMTPHKATGDLVAVNNNAVALFARCYVGERPQHRDRFELRKSFLDELKPTEKWALVEAARRAGRTAPATQPVLLEPPRRPSRMRT